MAAPDFVPRGWDDPAFLMSAWRKREAQLIKLLTVKHLHTVRTQFQQRSSATGNGVDITDFLRIMLGLLGTWTINRDELVIQLLNLFANIDVNKDYHIDWNEMLDYIVAVGAEGLDGAGAEGVPGVRASASFCFRPLGDGDDASMPVSSVAASADETPAGAAQDTFTNATWVTSGAENTGDVLLLAFRHGSTAVYLLKCRTVRRMPTLQPCLRMRLDGGGLSVGVTAALHVRVCALVFVASVDPFGGSAFLHVFDVSTLGDGSVAPQLTRIALPSTASSLVWCAPESRVLIISDVSGVVWSFKPTTHHIPFADIKLDVRERLQGPSRWRAAVALPIVSSGVLAVGADDGVLSLWDAYSGSHIDGCRVVAHHFGVAALVNVPTLNIIVSVGGPHPRRIPGLPADVYGILLWDITPWLDHCRTRISERSARASRTRAESRATPTPSRSASPAIRAINEGESGGGGPLSPPGSPLPAWKPPTESCQIDDEDFAPEASAVSSNARRNAHRAGFSIKRRAAKAALSDDEEEKQAAIGVGARASRFVSTNATVAALKPRVLLGHTAAVSALSVIEERGSTPMLVSTDESGAVRLWDVLEGVCIQTFRVYAAPATALSRGGIHRSAGADAFMSPGGGGARAAPSGALLGFAPDGSTIATTEGAAESALSALMEAGLLGDAVDGTFSSPAADAVLTAATRAGVGESSFLLLSNSAAQSAIVEGSRAHPFPLRAGIGAPGAGSLGGFLSSPRALPPGLRGGSAAPGSPRALSDSTRERLAAFGLLPQPSARMSRAMGGSSSEGPSGAPAAPYPVPSTTRTLKSNAASARAVFRGEARRAATAMLTHASHTVIGLVGRAQTAAIGSVLSAGAVQPRARGGSDDDLSACASISDIARLLAAEDEAAAQGKALAAAAEASARTGVAVSADAFLGHVDGGANTATAAAHEGLADRVPKGHPTIALLLPRRVGGLERRPVLLVGGERAGVPTTDRMGGSLAGRHGMKSFVWTPALPDREPIVTALFAPPTLTIVTVSASAVVVWDALTARPKRVVSKAAAGGSDFTAAALERDARKLIVGDLDGHTYVINLGSGAVMKELNPRPQPTGTASARITHLIYSPRAEVFTAAADGTLWSCDESVHEGFVAGMSNTLVRVVPVPRGARARSNEASTRLALAAPDISMSPRSPRAFSRTAVASSAMLSPGVFSLSSAASGGGFPLTPGGLRNNSISGGSATPGWGVDTATTPGVATVLSVWSSAAAPSHLITPHDVSSEAPSRAPAPSASASKDFAPPQATRVNEPAIGQLKISSVAIAVRLNLIAVAAKILCAPVNGDGSSSNGGIDSNGGDTSGENENTNNALLDDSSFAILLYAHDRPEFLAACARATYDPPDAITAAALRANAAASILRRATRECAVPPDPAAPWRSTSSGLHINTPASSKRERIVLSELGSHLLPPVTAMGFLSPLAALLSTHEDGGVRIWSVSPTYAPTASLRVLFFLPANFSTAAVATQGSDAPRQSRGLTTAASRLSAAAKTATGISVFVDEAPLAAQPVTAVEESRSGSGVAVTNVNRSDGRRGSLAGLDLDDVPALIARRYAVSFTSRAAAITPPMLLGSMCPAGHAAFLSSPLIPLAPAPGLNLFDAVDNGGVEEEVFKTPGAWNGAGSTGDIGNTMYAKSRGTCAPGGASVDAASMMSAAAPLDDPLFLHCCDAGSDGVNLWFGDCDGEVHRYFLSSVALAAAGLSATAAVVNESSSSSLEGRRPAVEPTSSTIATALIWSRTKSSEWAALQDASATLALQRGGGGVVAPSSTGVSPFATHPALASFYGEPWRHPFWPAVGEALSPSALARGADDALAFTPVQSGGSVLGGPPGAVWEGAWRAHAGGDVSVVSVIADSGFHGVLTGSQDGLARMWDHDGRLLGTLDGMPRFTAPPPSWEIEEVIKSDEEVRKQAEEVADTENKLMGHAVAAGTAKASAAGALPTAATVDDDDDDDKKDAVDPDAASDDPFAAASRDPTDADVPLLYGPGHGTGWSFDKLSMVHVTRERVMDGRSVYIPHGAHLRAVSAPSPASIFDARVKFVKAVVFDSAQRNNSSVRDAAAITALRVSAGCPSQSLPPAFESAVLPLAWRANRLALHISTTPPFVVPVRVVVQHAMPVASTLSTSASSTVLLHRQLHPSDAALGTVFAGPEYSGYSVCAESRGADGAPLAQGLVYAAPAPPQRAVLWHAVFDLRMRRARQIDAARQAGALITLSKIKNAHGVLAAAEKSATTAAGGDVGAPAPAPVVENSLTDDAGGAQVAAPKPRRTAAAQHVSRLAAALRIAVGVTKPVGGSSGGGAAASTSGPSNSHKHSTTVDPRDAVAIAPEWAAHPFADVLQDPVAATLQRLVDEKEASDEENVRWGAREGASAIGRPADAAMVLRKREEDALLLEARRQLQEERAARDAKLHAQSMHTLQSLGEPSLGGGSHVADATALPPRTPAKSATTALTAANDSLASLITVTAGERKERHMKKAAAAALIAASAAPVPLPLTQKGARR